MDTAAFLVTRHDPLLVGVSLLVAIFASYVALDLARRLQSAHGHHRLVWWAAGSVAMGTGVWAMHFIGMLGFDAGIPLGYGFGATLASWLAAVAAAAVALGAAGRDRLTPATLAAGSTAMAVGICSMHYLGIGALALVPGIVWQPALVAASVAIAWLASAVALAIFFALRRHQGWLRVRWQTASAVVLGIAIGGMHYTGMAAARLPQGAVCLSADALAGAPLAALVSLASLLMLSGALTLSILGAIADARETRLQQSLGAARDTLQRRAFEDALTGLPNRALLEDRLQHAVARLARADAPAARPAPRLAVLLLDIDGFKAVNDSFGHGAGDQVLREAGERLRSTVREGDTVARIGADEFVAVVEADAAETAAVALAQRALAHFALPFHPGGRAISLSCSIGIALYPDHGDDVQSLLGCADAAMGAAKQAGGAGLVVYESGMAGNAAEQLLLQEALRGAAERGELALHYQPKMRADGSGIPGVEALLRWKHPERGFVSPAVFIPVAERFGLIAGIGRWVLEAACEQLASWQAQGFDCRVAINLSPHELRQSDLPQRIGEALRRHGLDASRLICEITESAMMENLPAERGVLDAIAALGVWVSIDDFGTGYSSLAHLRNIPARELKIDRSFVADLGVEPDVRAILDAVIRLAHALRMEVVAEGVETAAQQAALVELGCDLLQGWAIARPMPADALLPWARAFAGRAAGPAAA